MQEPAAAEPLLLPARAAMPFQPTQPFAGTLEDVPSHLSRFHDSYPSKQRNAGIFQAVMANRSGAMPRVSTDYTELYRCPMTLQHFICDYKGILPRKYGQAKVRRGGILVRLMRR
jgi:hypothetical protein